MKCSHNDQGQPCDRECAIYWQCPNCKHEIAACDGHGGNDRANANMKTHIHFTHRVSREFCERAEREKDATPIIEPVQ